MKPGFAGTALPGISATILDDAGKEVKERQRASFAIHAPVAVDAPHRVGR